MTREETYSLAGNRRRQHAPEGRAKKDGTLTALDFAGIATSGAYPAGGPGTDSAVRACTGPNVRTELPMSISTPALPVPFVRRAIRRGHGLEQMMDALAEVSGWTRWSFASRTSPDSAR